MNDEWYEEIGMHLAEKKELTHQSNAEVHRSVIVAAKFIELNKICFVSNATDLFTHPRNY